jgi:hypothetical protein
MERAKGLLPGRVGARAHDGVGQDLDLITDRTPANRSIARTPTSHPRWRTSSTRARARLQETFGPGSG